MLLYAIGTAACSVAPNIWVLVVCRIMSALGIGGEWAAGAAMVAEVVPEKRRVEAGALLYTASPMGLFLATFVTFQITGVYFTDPAVSWRYVFLCGLIPAAAASGSSECISRSPSVGKSRRVQQPGKDIRAFLAKYRALTISGFCMAVTALIMWWSCNAFISVVAKGLARSSGQSSPLPEQPVCRRWRSMGQQWVKTATNIFNLGGLIATLLTIPAAKSLGRRKMFLVYFAGSAVALMAAFGLDLEPHTRLYMYFPIGLTTFGIFGAFTFYLPELFPTRLRGTGSGFTYNIGRLFAAVGPFVVGSVAASGANALDRAMNVLFWVGVVPILGPFHSAAGNRNKGPGT